MDGLKSRLRKPSQFAVWHSAIHTKTANQPQTSCQLHLCIVNCGWQDLPANGPSQQLLGRFLHPYHQTPPSQVGCLACLDRSFLFAKAQGYKTPLIQLPKAKGNRLHVHHLF